MKRARKILAFVAILVVIGGAAAWVMASNGKDKKEEVPTVEVKRGNLVDKALAVGTIEPRVEIDVKSQFSGVVKRQYAEVGDFVRAGTPLLDIQPNPTPKELVDAERQIELRQLEINNLKLEYERQQQLFGKKLVSEQDFDKIRKDYEQARLQLEMAKESLALLKEGKVSTDKGSFESVVRAPVSGFILSKMVEVGDPVVPLTSYQEGTVLMSMADMDDLIFRGTVDEIDVGRLVEGMPVEIKVGALANADVKGKLSKIWLKAEKKENSTVFPVEIEITDAVQKNLKQPESAPMPATLRAGYSANAEIIIEKRDSVLIIPERLIEFAGDTARVDVLLAANRSEKRIIKTGLSDAINIEVVSGLNEGMKVKEKPPKEIK